MLEDRQSTVYDEYVHIWNAPDYSHGEQVAQEKYAAMSELMGKYAEMNGHLISIYNIRTHRILYISENFSEFLGFNVSKETYIKWSSFYWLRDLARSHSLFIMSLSLFYRKTVKALFKSEKPENQSLWWYIHNFQLNPDGELPRHIGLQCKALEIDKNGNMEVMLLIHRDLRPLIKNSNTWWFEININEKYTYSYHHLEKKYYEKSLLSDREKEIVRLIEQGYDTKQISEKLEISPNTVDRHRKNILERTGFKDFSSYISIAKGGRLY